MNTTKVGEAVLNIEPNLGYDGNEPTLIELIQYYYLSHGCENWKELSSKYFDKWVKELNQLED